MKSAPSLTPLLLINAAIIALSAIALIALLQVDQVVHVLSYSYGLQFDLAWATPYWTFFRLAMALLFGSAVASFLSTLYLVKHRKSLGSPLPPIAVPAPMAEPRLTSAEMQMEIPEPVSEVEEAEEEAKDDGVEVAVALPMACSKCGKAFSQPLCMFDFRAGKPRLVNVCPYCNAVLAVSDRLATK